MKLRHGIRALTGMVFVLMATPAVRAEISPVRQTPVVRVVQENAEAVVNIATEHIILLRENPYWGSYGSEFDFIFDQFFGLHRPRQQALKLDSVGSGVIVDGAEGIIVTNAHVVHMASNIFVVLNDGTSIEGKVVYENLRDDLAIVKIDISRSLKEVELGTTDDILIGESVVAIGNPLGLENTVTSGVISGKDREISATRGGVIMEGLLQMDAPINPGNSGGALLNLDGKLVGINVAVVQNSQSIGFAIPVEKVKAALKAHANNKNLAVKRRVPRWQAPQAMTPPVQAYKDEWDPFDEVARMTEEMDRMFQDAFGRSGSQPGRGMFNTSIFYDSDFDVKETNNQYVIQLDIKGADKNKIDVEIHEGYLTVSGEQSVIEEEQGPGGFFSSQSIGTFMRTIPLPEDADADGVKTEVKDDVVIISFPKK